MGPHDEDQLIPINKKTKAHPDKALSNGNTTSAAEDHHTLTNGLSAWITTVFLVGEMAGAGILALPLAFEQMGLLGFVLFIVVSALSAYTGNLLGYCWLIVQDRYDEYKGHVRHPYPVIGEITYGKFARVVVSFSGNFTLFGVCVVFLILASQNIHDLLDNLCGTQISFCYLQLIVAGLLLPLSWFGRPKDFWPLAVASTLTTLLACVGLTLAMGQDKATVYKDTTPAHSSPDLLVFFQALAIVMYGHGGHPGFLILQNDMKQPKKFTISVYLAFVMITLICLPVAATGYFIYGKDIKANVLETVTPGPLLYLVQILMTSHLFVTFVILLSPVVQEIEELVNIRKDFTWRRMVTRSATIGACLFVAETVPKFGSIVALIGGTSIVTLTWICPPLFYLKLRSMEGNWPKYPVPLYIKVFLIELMVIGAVTGVCSTYVSFRDFVGPDSFTVPCYIDASKAQG